MLPLSEYACLTTGKLLLQRTPVVVSDSIQDRGSITGLRQTLHLAILTIKMLSALPSAVTLALPGTSAAKQGGWTK